MTESSARYLAPLEELSSADLDRIGTKAATLADLTRAGFPVPKGFVVTTAAFDRFLEADGLGPQSTPEAINAAAMPPDVADAVLAAAASLGDGPLAVRSSGVAEDLADASFAGQYDTVLGVRGADALLAAVKQCWASAFSSRVTAYQQARDLGVGRMAVLIQRLVLAEAAGVAFTANPVTGERTEIVVSAVGGLGERLVSGEARPDDWVILGQEAICRAAPEGAIHASQALTVAELARAVEAHFGGAPQDIEWALTGNDLFLLQARPITALPERVEWEAPFAGAFARHLRIGEWLGDPITPLFESWLLARLEARLYTNYRRIAGVPAPEPPSVVVHGWYFASLNFLPSSGAGMLWMMLRCVLPKALVHPRRVAMMNPATAKFGVEIFVREWRGQLLPRYRQMVDQAACKVERLAPVELVYLIEDLAAVAGDYFTSVTLVAGFAWKAEIPLVTFYHEHLASRMAGGYLRLLGGLTDVTLAAPDYAVASLDWFHPTLGECGSGSVIDGAEIDARRPRVVAERRQAEAEARTALAASPKALAQFERLLATTQRFASIREEQIRDFSLAWPVMRRAALRLGAALAERDVLGAAEDVFFLQREELLEALAPDTVRHLVPLVAERRRRWEFQRRLTPPLMIGEMTPMVRKMWEGMERAFRPEAGAAESGLRGFPASHGRATGPVRVIRSPQEFDRFRPGDVLVAPVTTPAWTPLFTRAVAVVTDTGSPAGHASLVAREYGLPAVVGTGDATSRLADGTVVTVDGTTGVVEVQP